MRAQPCGGKRNIALTLRRYAGLFLTEEANFGIAARRKPCSGHAEIWLLKEVGSTA